MSLGVLPAQHWFRRGVFALVHWRWFENLVFLAVLVNCAMLALYRPSTDDYALVTSMSSHFDLGFAMFFVLEMVLKLVALGAWSTDVNAAYFRVTWNRVDAVVVAGSLVSLVFPRAASVRALRAIRPLRVVVRSKKIQVGAADVGACNVGACDVNCIGRCRWRCASCMSWRWCVARRSCCRHW